MPDFDFGFGNQVSSEEEVTDNKPTENVTDIDDDTVHDSNNGDAENIDEIVVIEDENDGINDTGATVENDDEDSLEAGTIIEYDGESYTIDANGNLLDKDNNIFKNADEVGNWLKEVKAEGNTIEDENSISIDSIQDAIGFDLTDEEGNILEFENTPEGVANYVNTYINSVKEDIVNQTIDTLYNKYPILENVINYYVANGNSLDGFNQLKDRSNIKLDISNEAQCEAIVREAWKEDNRRGNVESYIEYLKSQDLLGATAQEELSAMVARDRAVADELARRADEEERASIERQKEYWGNIYNRVTKDRQIGKYQIPDTIICVKNGQRIAATPNDFFNYIYRVDSNGRSAYENEVLYEAKTNPEARITNDIISAYLKFTGGSFESLVNMAINEQQVKTIKIKSKQNTTPKVKVTHNKSNKSKSIDFGY